MAAYIVCWRAAMRFDKSSRIQPAARVFSIAQADKRRDEFAHFKMEMGEIEPAGCSDRGDLLSAPHVFAGVRENGLKMAVIGLHIFALAVLDIGMQQNNDIASTRAGLAGQ